MPEAFEALTDAEAALALKQQLAALVPLKGWTVWLAALAEALALSWGRPPALQLVLVLVAAAQEQLWLPVVRRRAVEALGAWPSVVAVMVLMMPDLGGVQPWVRQRG